MEKSTYPGAIWIHRFGGREFGEREGGRAEDWTGASAPCLTPWQTQVADCQNHTMEKVATSRLILYLMAKRQTTKLRFFKASSQLEYCAMTPWRYQSAQYELCSCSPPDSAALMVQGCIKHSTSTTISWHCTYSKYRTKLPGFHDLQQPGWLMLKLKYFHVAAWISSAVGKDLLCWDTLANYISIWHQRWFAQIYSILGLFHLQFGGELMPLVFCKLGLCLLVQSRKM